MEDAATGGTTVREEPLSYDMLHMLCRPKGNPAFTLNFIEGCWEVTGGSQMRVLDESHYSAHEKSCAKRLDKEHRSFSLHFTCGEICKKRGRKSYCMSYKGYNHAASFFFCKHC